jgi:hypothetical protein
VRNIRNLIGAITHHRQAEESGMSYHVLGECSIYGVSAEFRLGTIWDSFTRFSIGVLVEARVGNGDNWGEG